MRYFFSDVCQKIYIDLVATPKILFGIKYIAFVLL